MSDFVRRGLLALLSPTGKRGRLLILTFHQVPAKTDPLAPSVASADAFEEQMRWLSEICNILPLPDAAEMLRNGQLPARAACITFDDGYRNNIEVAAPILERLGLSATFFITAGAVERGIMWNDLVIEGVRRAGSEFDLTAMGLGEHALDSDAARRAAIQFLIDQIKYQPLQYRLGVAEYVFGAASSESEPRLMMTPKQVAELAHRGFDVGAHTISHPILATLSPEDARSEIDSCREWVRDVTGTAPRSFAYPNGRPGTDFGPEHERMAEQAGYSVAVSMRWAAARRVDSAFALPRFAPWERDRSGFHLRLIKTVVRSYIGGD
jgi:peptidoglycan/xylan/chitin deacetylase (PgdA/CDA1 family)